MSCFPLNPIVWFFYKMQIIDIDWFTVFYYMYIKCDLCILTGVPRISLDMWWYK